MYSIQLFLLLFTICVGVNLNHRTGDDYSLCGMKNNCVKKCCPEKYVLRKKVCVLSKDSDFSFDVYDKLKNITNTNITFNIIHDYNTNCKGKTILKLSPNIIQKDKFYVQVDGSLFKPDDLVTRSVKFTDYCLEIFLYSTRPSEFSALVCYEEENLEKIDHISYMGELEFKLFIFVFGV